MRKEEEIGKGGKINPHFWINGKLMETKAQTPQPKERHLGKGN